MEHRDEIRDIEIHDGDRVVLPDEFIAHSTNYEDPLFEGWNAHPPHPEDIRLNILRDNKYELILNNVNLIII